MNEQKKKERLLMNNLHLMNYNGKIKTTIKDTYGSVATKFVYKIIDGVKHCYKITYKIRSHQISLPFNDDMEIRETLRYGKTIAREMLENEMQELLEKYIDMSIKDMEINCLCTDKWFVLTRSDGSIYKDANGNVILVKYYRITPTSEYLAEYHSTDELKKMEKKDDN